MMFHIQTAIYLSHAVEKFSDAEYRQIHFELNLHMF